MKRPTKVALVTSVIALCALGGTALVGFILRRGDVELRAEVAKLRAAGYPTEPADLVRKVPASENAAPIYIKIRANLSADRALNQAAGDVRRLIGSEVSKEAQAAGTAAWPTVQPLLVLFEEAADRAHADFQSDYRQGASLLFPQFADMKAGSQLLAIKAEYQARAGDWKGAMQSIRRSLNIAHQAGEEPNIIAALVEAACEANALRGLDRVVATLSDQPAALDAAAEILDGLDPVVNLHESIGGEIVMGRMTIQGFESAGGVSPSEMSSELRRLDLAMKLKSARTLFEARYVAEIRKLAEELPPDPQKWREAEAVAKSFDDRIQQDESFGNAFNRLLFPLFEGFSRAVGSQITRRRLARTEIELYRIRNSTGRFPTDLTSLGNVANDPFTDKPFHYRPAATGFLVYSIGSDGSDDGGQITRKAGKYDIAIDTRHAPLGGR